MLKFLYRSCLITILSSALLTQSFAFAADTAGTGSGVAGVHDTFVNNVNGQSSTSGTTTTKEGVVIDNKTGVQTVTKTASLEGHKTETNMLNSITMAVVGLIAARLYKYKMTTDVMLAAAGGAAFLIGEFSSSKDVNQFTKDLTYRSDGKVDNEQMAALEKMKTDLEKARDAVKKKKQFQNIAFMAFAAAGIAALILKSSVLLAQEACATAKTTLASTCSATMCPAPNQAAVTGNITSEQAAAAEKIAEAEVPAPSATQCTSDKAAATQCTALAATTSTVIAGTAATCATEAAAADSATLGTSGGSFTLTAQTGIAACKAAELAKRTACAAQAVAEENAQTCGFMSIVSVPPAYNKLFTPNVVVENKLNPNFFEKLINLFIPQAKAGQMDLLFGVGGIGVGMALSGTLGAYVDTWLFTPMKRSAVWGVLSVLCKMAVDSSQKTIDDLEKQIAKVTAIIASMTGAGQGVVGQQMAVAQKAVMPTFGVSGGGFDALTSDGSNIPCVTTGATSNCPSVTKAMSSTPEWKALPADVQGLAMGVGNFMNKVQGKSGISADAMGAGAALSGSASGLNKMLGNARANVNSQLRKMGQPAVDFNKRESDMLKQMNQITADGLQKSGMSAGGFLASMGKGGGAADGAVKKPEAPSKTFAKSTSAPAVGGGIAAPKGSMFNFKDEKPGFETGAEGAGGKNDVYEMSAKSDISADAGGSIFNLISERYFKSAYPKLLEEAPAPAEAPAPVKK